MRLNRLSVALTFVGIFAAFFIFVGGVAHAQNPAGPPEYFPPWPPADWRFPAYNFAANGGGTAWGYSVPQDFRYPPVSNEGYDPSGNIETL